MDVSSSLYYDYLILNNSQQWAATNIICSCQTIFTQHWTWQKVNFYSMLENAHIFVLFIQLIFLPKLLFLRFTKHKQILALQTLNFGIFYFGSFFSSCCVSHQICVQWMVSNFITLQLWHYHCYQYLLFNIIHYSEQAALHCPSSSSIIFQPQAQHQAHSGLLNLKHKN